MSGRIDKLLRQRELVREHLRWLDDEIAAAHPADQPSAAAHPPAAATDTAPPRSLFAATATPAESSAIESALPEPDSPNLHSEVRNGCLLYFGIAFAAFGLLVAFIYWRY